MDIWEATHVRAFRLKNITPERLNYERQRAADDIITVYRRYLEAKNDEEDSIVIELFREWGKALITAKELSIEITPNDFSAQAASLIDSVLGEGRKNKNKTKMNTWYKLFANIMNALSRLQIPEGEIDRVRIFGTRKLKPFGG